MLYLVLIPEDHYLQFIFFLEPRLQSLFLGLVSGDCSVKLKL